MDLKDLPETRRSLAVGVILRLGTGKSDHDLPVRLSFAFSRPDAGTSGVDPRELPRFLAVRLQIPAQGCRPWLYERESHSPNPDLSRVAFLGTPMWLSAPAAPLARNPFLLGGPADPSVLEKSLSSRAMDSPDGGSDAGGTLG